MSPFLLTCLVFVVGFAVTTIGVVVRDVYIKRLSLAIGLFTLISSGYFIWVHARV